MIIVVFQNYIDLLKVVPDSYSETYHYRNQVINTVFERV
jgi:hypothetical protein